MKNVIITGSSRGIGKEIAMKFAQNGYNLVITYNQNYEQAKKVFTEIKNKYQVEVLIIKCDLANEEEIKNMIQKAIEKFKRIDILINNAAIAIDTTFENKTKENFMKILEINLVGTFLVCKYLAKHMLNNKYGKIINISSNNAIDNYYVESLDYDSSKAGVISLTHNLASYLAPYVNVNCICPGWVDTQMNKELSEEFRKKEEEKILLDRFGTPEEIANVVYFLASDEARYINDTIIKVDGGIKR